MAGEALRPSKVCGALLDALEASEGRRRMRKRDQTPDAFGLSAKRCLLELAVTDDPESEEFEAWLLAHVHAFEPEFDAGAIKAMARVIYDEWRLASEMPAFAGWLACGAPSEDAQSRTHNDASAAHPGGAQDSTRRGMHRE